jgi:hypothetical protein
MNRLLSAAVAAAATLALAVPAVAQPGDGRHGGGYGYGLEGMGVKDAQVQLSNAGYTKARNIKVGGRQFDLWANPRAREACVGFTSISGRVTEVRTFDNTDCGVVAGGGGRLNPDQLYGMRVDDAKWNLQNYGYSHERNVRIDGKQWDLWVSSRGRDCIGFTSRSGILSGVQTFRSSECTGGSSPGGGGGWRFDPRDLPGLSVDQAKRELSNAGFEKARNITIRGKQWDLWFDDRGRDGGRCIGFTSISGRVTAADDFSPRDCY